MAHHRRSPAVHQTRCRRAACPAAGDRTTPSHPRSRRRCGLRPNGYGPNRRHRQGRCRCRCTGPVSPCMFFCALPRWDDVAAHVPWFAGQPERSRIPASGRSSQRRVPGGREGPEALREGVLIVVHDVRHDLLTACRAQHNAAVGAAALPGGKRLGKACFEHRSRAAIRE